MATWSRPRSIAAIDLTPRDLRTNLRRRQIRRERIHQGNELGGRAASRTASLEPLTCGFLILNLSSGTCSFSCAPRGSARFDPFRPKRIVSHILFILTVRFAAAILLGRPWSGQQNNLKQVNPLVAGLTISRTLSFNWSLAK